MFLRALFLSLFHLEILVARFERKYSLILIVHWLSCLFLFVGILKKGEFFFTRTRFSPSIHSSILVAYFLSRMLPSRALKTRPGITHALQSAIVALVKFNSERTVRAISSRNYERRVAKQIYRRYVRAFIEKTRSKSAVERILFSEHTSRFVSLISRGCHPL